MSPAGLVASAEFRVGNHTDYGCPWQLFFRAADMHALARMDRKSAAAYTSNWVGQNGIPEAEREKFRDMAESELVSLHEGNFARYQIRPSEFEAWQQIWGDHKSS